MNNDDRYLDPEQKFYNYRTADVNGSDIFDTRKASNSDSQSILDGDTYWKENKNTVSKIVRMSPKEYFTACAKDVFKKPVANIINQWRQDKGTLEHLKEVITKYKKKFPLPYIDYARMRNPSQEGLHRMMVAGDLFGWDTKFPVQIIDWYDKDKADEEKKAYHKANIERMINKGIDKSLRYVYYNQDELKDQLYSDIEDALEYEDEFEGKKFKLDLSRNKRNDGYIVTINDTYTCEINDSDIIMNNRTKKDDEDLFSNLDAEDINFDDDLDSWLKKLNLGIRIQIHSKVLS